MPAETNSVTLPADTNQALGLAQFAIDFMSDTPGKRGEPDPAVVERINMFHLDATLCGLSAIALQTNSPSVLRREAALYPAAHGGAKSKRAGTPIFGSKSDVAVEKAIVANVAAVREWDSNGTNFGYSATRTHHRAGEFGHNDFYSVPIAAVQLAGLDGRAALKGMILVDEIRGRLAEVFSLKTYKIDHVVHGAIASAAVFGAMTGATAAQIESAIGMLVAHYIPFRAIRAGHQLSDSKGASAAITTEAAILCMKRSMAGFVGPKDIFRNPEAIFRIFEGPGQFFQKVGATKANTEKKHASPFDLVLSRAGSDFTVMGMHFKLGLYEHQSAGALQGLIDLLNKRPQLLEDQSGDCISKIVVKAYEPAFGIIGDPHKRDPKTRQSADHSMLYLVCTMLRKALEHRHARSSATIGWKELMLTPHDFDRHAIANQVTRSLMGKMAFEWGGPDYDAKYPDGIPTSMVIADEQREAFDSGLVMYPAGHARNTTADLKGILAHKWNLLGKLAASDPAALIKRLEKVEKKSAPEIASLFDFEILKQTFEE